MGVGERESMGERMCYTSILRLDKLKIGHLANQK